ncbi:hypothetical protein [Litorilituus lipolyticus]|uniref:Uncharacterized protein n=1 Tax=Litorilituus lipolyticus TaxID=2491017 RepID=A0A502KX24_9GAMM|nr:hypothetical protein [Litorilituus lipolyticus]TPH14223.1 hypothetical protein EPA86_11900 [Litorilituus lipolyticus]
MNNKGIKLTISLTVVVILAYLIVTLLSSVPQPIASNTTTHIKVEPATTKTSSIEIADTELTKQKPLTTAPVQKNNANHIALCDKAENTDKFPVNKFFGENSTALSDNKAKLIESFSLSSDVDNQIALAFIISEGEDRLLLNQLQTLHKEHSDNKYLAYHVLSLCSENKNQCSPDTIEQSIALDRQNGATWLLSALHAIKTNNTEQAEAALLEAANAPVYDEYWSEHIDVFESALAKASVAGSVPNEITTLDYIYKAKLPSYGNLVKFCRKVELSDANVVDACLRMGEQLTQGKGTMLSHLIGISLQEAMYKKYEDDTQLAQLAQMRKTFTERMELSAQATDLALQSQARTEEWLQQIKTMGEYGASEYLIEEANNLSADANFDPCKVDW